MTRLSVVGDTLLDVDWTGDVNRVTPDAPVPVVEEPAARRRPGGAGLAATLAAARGASVTLVTALGTDGAANELRNRLEDTGVTVVDLGLDGPTPEKLRVRASGQSLARIDRGCRPVVPPGPWTAAAGRALTGADAILVADYGRGIAGRALPAVQARARAAADGRYPVVWDPHRDGPTPPPGLAALTPNATEASGSLGGAIPATVPDLAATAERLARSWGSPVVLTAGERGALIASPSSSPSAGTMMVPASPVPGDSCGAGDCFAAALTVALARGRPLPEAAAAAVAAAGRYIAAGGSHVARLAPSPPTGGDGLDTPGPDARQLAADLRAGGGTVVATGGCFDLLHSGHLRTLESARTLGDCLIVCLNGDDSVRRLKGPDRPVNAAHDRARLLLGLRCVDAVAVFDEDTPVTVLETIRPDVFVKGGDYSGIDIAESRALSTWGGQLVVLPLVADRSTTRMIGHIRRRQTAPPAGSDPSPLSPEWAGGRPA